MSSPLLDDRGGSDPGDIDPSDIDGVLFDFHSTLVDQGDAVRWLQLAWERAGRRGSARTGLGRDRFDHVAGWLDRIWEGARDVDPDSRRDLSPRLHREVFDTLSRTVPDLDPPLAAAVYDTMLELWSPYDDTAPTLTALRAAGVKTALVSNIGIDVRPVLDRTGLAGLLDAVALSFEVGVVKPDIRIFADALDLIGVTPHRALMVGDSWREDGGAAQLGIRTLILPRTLGPVHGLEAVLGLIRRPGRSARGFGAASAAPRRSPGQR